MRVASSLTNRIFLACTLATALSLGFAFWLVNARATREAEEELRRGLVEAGRLVDEHRAATTDTFTRLARLIGDLPKLKAAVETGDPPTVQPLAEDYAREMRADLLVLTSPDGKLLAAAGEMIAGLEGIIGEADTDEVATVVPHGRGLLQVVSVPVFLAGDLPALLGRLTAGFFMDDAMAEQFKGLTASEVAFTAGGRIVASTLPPDRRPESIAADAQDIHLVTLGGEEFLALARPFAGQDREGAPAALILRSRTGRLQFLTTIRNGLVAALAVTVLLATLASYAVARTMTRPLAAVTTAMREMAVTGDLARRIPVRSRPWDDEDARLLAATFNTMTESIARFQQEATQRERLSSLGRLSTIIAHEIRNPLMIIKTALPSLRRDDVSPEERREATADIEEETARLNRIVTEVLDFAKPMRFDFAEADLNEICAASAQAAWAGVDGAGVSLDLDRSIPPMRTDAERLRTALVNLLTNARHAVEAIDGREDGPPPAVATAPVNLRTRRNGARATISIEDRGPGIAPQDMPHIFDPYFTTSRAGTGLGLPITKNIIEGLGGRIAVSSRPGEGTQITVELPLAVPEAAA